MITVAIFVIIVLFSIAARQAEEAAKAARRRAEEAPGQEGHGLTIRCAGLPLPAP